MASWLNKAQVIWHLTADPEVTQTANWQTVASFSVATNREWKDQNGEKQSVADYHNIVVWWKLAEIVEQYLSKWKQVFIEWRMQTRSWEADDGSKRYKTEIVADQMLMLWSWKKSDDFDDDFEKPKKAVKKSTPKHEEEISIEDLPF